MDHKRAGSIGSHRRSAQRLVRRLCKDCKQPYDPNPSELPRDFPLDQLQGRKLYRPTGCRACRNLGYLGRLGIYELMVTNDEVRQLAHDRASSWKVKQAAVRNGMCSLRLDGWKKVLLGTTSIEEIATATKGDREGLLDRK